MDLAFEVSMFCGSVSISGVGVSHGIGSWDWGGGGEDPRNLWFRV